MTNASHNAFALAGAQVFDGETIHNDTTVIVADGLIDAVVAENYLPAGLPVATLAGGILAPGFVDVQVNGGGGVMFNETPTLETVSTIAKSHRRFGTTSLLPTLISSPWEVMTAAADAVRHAIAAGVPGIRGIHFEGPYLNPKRRGVHAETAIRAPDPGAVDLFTNDGLSTVLVTVAPEMVPASFIDELTRKSVKVSAGHSEADPDQVAVAIQKGLSGFTHLFNAMPPLQSRAPGIVGAALNDPDTWCGLIVDGHHVDPVSLRVALAAKRPGKMLLVTDGMATVGMDDKRFILDGQEIRAEGGRLVTSDGVLAGADLDMAGAVRNAIALCSIELSEALRMASRYPAEFLGLDDVIGRIAPGFEADLVHLTDDLQVGLTWIAGKPG